jgi:hypothetical protein
MADIVQFDVSGRIFKVSRALIDAVPDSMLATMISETWEKEPGKPMFIDRDSDLFAQVLNYLRYGSIELPVTITQTMFQRELDYYAIPEADGSVTRANFWVYVKEHEARYNEVDESLKAKGAEMIAVRTAATTAEYAMKMYQEELKMYQEELNELRAQHESAAEIMAILTLNNSSLSEARENAMRLEIENSNLKAQIEQLRAGGSANITPESADVSAIAANYAVIKKLEGEKERLVHYTKKTLQKFQEKYLVELQDCKKKLKEKCDRIVMLEMKAANEKVAQKREEK